VKAPAGPTAPNKVFSAKNWGTCKVEHYTNKSYLRCKNKVGLKPDWKLIIGSEHAKHVEITDELMKAVSKGSSKEALMAERAKITEEWDNGVDIA